MRPATNQTVARVRPRLRVGAAACGAVVCAAAAALAGDFASSVVDYAPAPGQFVNDAVFNDPTLALGPPVGGGLLEADNTSAVTLGSIGGSITLAFDNDVLDDPRNPMGLDAIVFGNAFYVTGDPQRRWAEAATIEISADANGNGLADDPWYLIPGSHPAASSGGGDAFVRTPMTWDNDVGDPSFPPTNGAWYPAGAPSPMTTHAFALPTDPFGSTILVNPLGAGSTQEGVHGYADCTPVLLLGDTDADNLIDEPSADPAVFYTSPDNPVTVGVDAGSGGGDAFDIAWAVDPVTGDPAGLTGFRFIRLTSAVAYAPGIFGEISAEIDAVADVRPTPRGADWDASGGVDLNDYFAFLGDFFAGFSMGTAAGDVNADGVTDLNDYFEFLGLFFAEL